MILGSCSGMDPMVYRFRRWAKNGKGWCNFHEGGRLNENKGCWVVVYAHEDCDCADAEYNMFQYERRSGRY
jgi:hypothetical protein